MRRLVVLVLGALLVLIAATPAQASTRHAPGASAVATHRVVTFMSLGEYAAAVKTGAAHFDARFMPGAAGAVKVPAKPVSWSAIVFSATDWNGLYIPTREGTTSFGYTKIKLTHNLYNPAAINAPYHSHPDSIAGTRQTYSGLALINGQPQLEIKSVADTSHTTDQGQTPDGRIVGTITSYCVGYTLCPDWING